MDDIAKKTIGQLGNLGKGLGKVVSDEAKHIVKATRQQAGIEKVAEEKGKQIEQAAVSASDSDVTQVVRNQDTQDFVRDLYGSSTQKKPGTIKEHKKQEDFTKFADEHKDKPPEEIQELYRLRQQLHKETYYDPLVDRSQTHDQSTIEEEQKKQETTQQRMERLQQEDLQKKQKEEEKKQPISVTRSQTNIETKMGASG